MTSFGRTATVLATNLVDGTQIKITGLRITFNITKGDKAGENKAQITVLNLSRASRELLQSQVTEGGTPQTQVELRVGYQSSEEEKLLFRGIGETVSTFKAPDWETKIVAEDGVKKIKEATFEKKFPAGTSLQAIVDDLLKAAGITTAISVPIISTIPRALAFSGDPLKSIQDLQSTYKFDFDIQDEEAVVRPKNTSESAPIITTLSKSTGLIRSPRVKGDLVLVDALCDGNLKPSNYVKLETNEPGLSGRYLIKKGTYKGDNWGGDWIASLELMRATTTTATETNPNSFGNPA